MNTVFHIRTSNRVTSTSLQNYWRNIVSLKWPEVLLYYWNTLFWVFCTLSNRLIIKADRLIQERWHTVARQIRSKYTAIMRSVKDIYSDAEPEPPKVVRGYRDSLLYTICLNGRLAHQLFIGVIWLRPSSDDAAAPKKAFLWNIGGKSEHWHSIRVGQSSLQLWRMA